MARHDREAVTATGVTDWGSDRFAGRPIAGNLTSRSQPSAKGCHDTGDGRPRWTHRPDAGVRACAARGCRCSWSIAPHRRRRSVERRGHRIPARLEVLDQRGMVEEFLAGWPSARRVFPTSPASPSTGRRCPPATRTCSAYCKPTTEDHPRALRPTAGRGCLKWSTEVVGLRSAQRRRHRRAARAPTARLSERVRLPGRAATAPAAPSGGCAGIPFDGSDGRTWRLPGSAISNSERLLQASWRILSTAVRPACSAAMPLGATRRPDVVPRHGDGVSARDCRTSR